MVHGDNLLEILLPGDSPPHLVIYGQVVLVPFYKKFPASWVLYGQEYMLSCGYKYDRSTT